MICSRSIGRVLVGLLAAGTLFVWGVAASRDASANRLFARETGPARVGEKSYGPGAVNLESSRVYIRVGKSGLGHEHGVVGTLQSGMLRLGSADDAGELVFKMGSFRADTAEARQYVGLSGTTDASTQQQVNTNMLGPAVLDTNQFPTAVFRVTSAKRMSDPSRRGLPQYLLAGDFTLHGTTQPVRIPVDVDEKDGWLHLRGGFAILQTQFGIRPFSKAFGAIGVADRLEIFGDLWVAPDSLPTGTADPASR